MSHLIYLYLHNNIQQLLKRRFERCNSQIGKIELSWNNVVMALKATA